MNTFLLLLFNLLLYSFLGWLLEGVFNWATKGSFVKSGFLYGPFKPMYGIAATLLILIYPLVSFPTFLLIGLAVPTIIEFITGWLMMYFFNTHYWDYSGMNWNYKGLVCLRFSFFWCILSFALIYGLNPFVSYIYSFLYPLWQWVWPIALAYFLVDVVWTSRNKFTYPTI